MRILCRQPRQVGGCGPQQLANPAHRRARVRCFARLACLLLRCCCCSSCCTLCPAALAVHGLQQLRHRQQGRCVELRACSTALQQCGHPQVLCGGVCGARVKAIRSAGESN